MVHYDGYESHEQAVSMKPPAVFYEEALKMMTGAGQKESIGALEMFLAIWPDFALAHNDLGVLYSGEGEKEKALEHYERVLELEPWNVDVRQRLGELGEGLRSEVRSQGSEIGSQRSEDRGRTTEGRGQRVKDGWMDGGLDDSGKYLVSAIVSTYNSERFIRGCLEDLEAQTIADRVEIIVVNSGSEQGEEAIVKEFQQEYSNIKYIRTDERETVYAAWNRGIMSASGKYVTNANTDDRHRKDAFEVMVKVLEARPEVTLVYADLIITEMENEIFESCTHAGHFRWFNWDRNDLLEKGCFMGPQPMWRKSVHDEYGYFDDSFITSGDYEFWLRISQTNTFLHISEFLGLYLKSAGGIEHSNRKRQSEENKRTIEMYKAAFVSGTIIRRQNTNSVKAVLEKEERYSETRKNDENQKEYSVADLESERALQMYQSILPLINRSKYEEAISSLENLLETFPDFALAHNELGVLYWNVHDNNKALDHYKNAIRLQSDNITFQKNLAHFYYVELGQVDKAMRLYSKVLSISPEDIETLFFLAHIGVFMEKFDDARGLYERILKIAPGHKEAQKAIDKIDREKGQRTEEIDDSLIGGLDDSGKYLVSAIVSTYNSEQFIRGCLEDLEAQTIADRIEIIVVNSGSEQNEEAVIREFQEQYENIRYIKTKDRETVYQAWNRGIKASKSKYITNANTDDRHRQDAIELLVKTLDQHPESAVAYGDSKITKMPNETFEHCTCVGNLRWPDFDRSTMLNLCYIGPHPVWRRSLHDELGFFDEGYRCCADYEFWLRVAEQYDLIHVTELVGLYYLDDNTLSRQGDLPLFEAEKIKHAYRKKFALVNPNMSATTSTVNILFVVHSFLPDYYGGVEIYTYDMARLLIGRGYRVSVFYPCRDETAAETPPSIREEVFDGIRIFKFIASGLYGLEHIVCNESMETCFEKLLDSHRFGIVHFQHFLGLSLKLPKIARERGAHVCVTLHDHNLLCFKTHLYVQESNSICSGPESVEKCTQCLANSLSLEFNSQQGRQLAATVALRSEYAREIFNTANIVSTPSQYLAEKFHAFGFGHSRITVVPLGIPLVASTTKVSCNKLTFSFLGQIHPLKQPLLAVEAFKMVRGDSRLVFWGWGPQSEELRQAIAVSPTMEYRGAYKPEDLPTIFGETDVVIVPSLIESYSLVTREALSAGIPVIAAAVGGIPEIIVHRQNGLLFNARDSSELAEHMQKLVDKPYLIEEFRKSIPPIKTRTQDVNEWSKRYDALIAGNPGLCSIIILTHNQLEYTRKCIESIFKCTKGSFELIVVDNGSTDGTVEYLEKEVGGRKTEGGGQRSEVGGRTDGWMNGRLHGRDEDGSQRSGVRGQGKKADDSLSGRLDDWGKQGDRKGEVRIIKNKENLGFAAGNNQGMAAARGNYILLMNNDIVVTPGWFERMVSCAERDPKIGIVGPMSNYVTGPQLITEVTYNKTNLEGLNDFAADVSNKYAGKTKQFLHVVGFCMLIKRAVIDKIGGLDEIYGLGNLEDADFCLRATLAGFGSWIAEDCFIHHFGSRTFTGAKIDYRESLHKNWDLFKEKWDIPREMPYGSYEIPYVLERGFIPEKHISPLPEKNTITIYEAEDLSENEGGGRVKIQFKKKNKPDMVSIIIPVAGHAKHLKKCIENIKKYTPEAHEIIFVDNGCRGAMLKWIRQTVKRKSTYRLIKAGKKAGFGKCFNRGMEASSGEYILILRDNVIVADGWADGMLKCINSPDDVGIVGPMTNAKRAGIQYVADSGHLKIGQFKNYAGAFRERNRYRRIPSREIADFCMLFRRNLVEHIGPFDEEMEQGAESNDYCLRAALEGYNNFIVGDVFVLCGDLPPQGNKRSFTHKWRGIDVKSHDGERLGVLNALRDAEKLYQREEIDKAIVTLIDGIKYCPDEKSIYHRLAEMLIDCERFKEGLEAIKSLPEDKKGNVRTLELTGYCKAGLELYDEAAQYADRALSLNGSSAPALNLMGVLTHRRGDKSASRDFFNKAVASDPGYGEAYTNLGVLAWEGGRKDDAMELLEKGFILSPAVADNITAYHSAISETSKFERAEGVFREAKSLYPESRRIAFLLIDILIRQEKHESAMRDIHKAMITFGINDAILSAAQSVLDRFDAQETKDMGKNPGLSLCMIVKDEEDCLSRCLLSVMPVVDEMVIVDTGSTDRTKEIAKTFGAKVYDFEWTDDFSEARNLSLSKAAGDWILVLDADETISPLDYERLTKIVKRNTDHPAAYSIITRNYIRPTHVIGWTCNNGQYAEEEDGTGWYPSPKVRLFTNDNRIRFENTVHELVEPSLKRCGIKIRKCGIPVHHYGQLDADHYDAKSEAYYLLGKKKLEEEGENLKTLIELAVQAEGKLGKYEEAVDLWKRVLKIDPGNIKALLNMGCTCFKLEKYEPARTSTKIVMKQDPGLKEAVIIYTTCEVLIGDAEKTIPILENLLKREPEYPLAIAVLAAVYGMGEEREKGLAHIKYLMKMGFLCAEYLHDLSNRLISVGKTDSAVTLLEFAVESGNGTREIRELLDSLLIGD